MAALDGILNAGRDLLITPEQQARREQQIQYLEMIKTACIAAMIGSVVFLVIFPKILTLVLAGIFAFGARELFTAAANVLEMVKNVRTDALARTSRDNLITQISKNTLIVGSIISINNPSFDEMIHGIDNLKL